eukprot:213838-Chlamydomonas_euryale.AAC.4
MQTAPAWRSGAGGSAHGGAAASQHPSAQEQRTQLRTSFFCCSLHRVSVRRASARSPCSTARAANQPRCMERRKLPTHAETRRAECSPNRERLRRDRQGRVRPRVRGLPLRRPCPRAAAARCGVTLGGSAADAEAAQAQSVRSASSRKCRAIAAASDLRRQRHNCGPEEARRVCAEQPGVCPGVWCGARTRPSGARNKLSAFTQRDRGHLDAWGGRLNRAPRPNRVPRPNRTAQSSHLNSAQRSALSRQISFETENDGRARQRPFVDRAVAERMYAGRKLTRPHDQTLFPAWYVHTAFTPSKHAKGPP